MNYAEAVEFLQGLQQFGMHPGLETTRRLATLMGNPEGDLRFIHVAGTNGKGSTCAFLESIYRTVGLRVGLYTSPHLVTLRERIQVNRGSIQEVDVARLVQRMRGALESLGPMQPTFFEFLTVMALCWFHEQECDLVIWETGLGGRLDSTNIVTPMASVITNVGWDHMEWLGPTLASIASEKAGIIKPGVPVVTAAAEPEALEVICRTAESHRAPLHVVTSGSNDAVFARSVGLPLAGSHQVLNAAVAITTARVLDEVMPVDTASIIRGLYSTHWPGRFQVFPRGEGDVVVDGAHNRPAFEALAATLRQLYAQDPYVLVLGMLGDKDCDAAIERLVPGASRVVVVPVQSRRGADPDVLVEKCRAVSGRRQVERAESVAAAMQRIGEPPLTIVTGSLYLAGEAIQFFEGGTNSERALNDWSRIR